MKSTWTNDEINHILVQLNKLELPFVRYCFFEGDSGFSILGSGGYANVYAASERYYSNNDYAIKVIGFGNKNVDSEEFFKSVSIQKELGRYNPNVVKLYDYCELKLLLDNNNNIIEVERKKKDFVEKIAVVDEAKEGNILVLQFVVMEKLEPVITRDGSMKFRLFPMWLEQPESLEKYIDEIYKISLDIGKALLVAHKRNLLHRDVKLENVFYDTKNKCYKLGDFGIAVVTDDGMASTIAFTNGYGAPEVVSSKDDKYDNTADIYSLGMLMYLLLNNLHFPSSNSYVANSKLQYSQGYVLPKPANDCEELYEIITYMCAFNPDDRYQVIEDMIEDLSVIKYGESVVFKIRHNNLTLTIGSLLLLFGIVSFFFNFMPEIVPGYRMKFDIWSFILFGFGLYAANLMRYQGSSEAFDGVVTFIGFVYIITTGFTMWKLALFIVLMVFSYPSFICSALGIIIVKLIYTVMPGDSEAFLLSLSQYRWITALCITISSAFLYQYSLIKGVDTTAISLYLEKNKHWYMSAFVHAGLLLVGLIERSGVHLNKLPLMNREVSALILSCDFVKVGLIGFLFSVVWIIREKVLIRTMTR